MEGNPRAARFSSHANDPSSAPIPAPPAAAAAGGPRPPTASPPSHATARNARRPLPRCLPPRVPSGDGGPRLSPTVPGGGQPKATREALCPACLPDCCPQRPPLVTRPRSPSTPPDAMGAPCPSIAAPLSCPCLRSPFASLP